MDTVPALDVDLCDKCHSSVSLHAYGSFYPHDGSRASTIPPTTSAQDFQPEVDDLAIVNTEIGRLDKALKALRSYQASLTSYIEERRTYFRPSPVRALPTELLNFIFSLACDSVQPEYYKTPLHISQTCFRWHEISLSLPHIWSNLYADPHGDRLYQLYLSRSGNAAISLRVHQHGPHELADPGTDHIVDIDKQGPFYIDSDEEEYSIHLEFISSIHIFATRWRHLELQMTYRYLELFITRFEREEEAHDRLYSLESLTLAIDYASNPGSGWEFPNTFFFAKNLRKVTLRDHDWGSLLRLRHCFAWENITHFSTTTADCANFFVLSSILGAKSDVTLVLDGATMISRRCTINVTTLVLCPYLWSKGLEDLFLKCSMPVLRSLEISETTSSLTFTATEWVDLLLHLPRFLIVSKCPLEHFKIEMHRSGHRGDLWDNLKGTLENAPSLKRLEVVEGDARLLTEELFDQILLDAAHLCKLQSMVLVWREAKRIPVDRLDRMLLLRFDQRAASSVVIGVRDGGTVGESILRSMLQHRNSGGGHIALW